MLPDLNLLIERYDYGDTYTMGKLLVEGMLFSDTIEPPSLHLSKDMPLSEIKAKKVYGKTAIPTGRYENILSVSPTLKDRAYAREFGGKFPYFKDVPAWTGVMYHPFNFGYESKGCVGAGELWVPGKIINATQAYQDLMRYYLMPAFNRGQRVFTTIKEL